jgi:hypothetical protein
MQVCIYAGGCWRMQELQMKGASSWWWKAYLSALCNSPQIGSGESWPLLGVCLVGRDGMARVNVQSLLGA